MHMNMKQNGSDKISSGNARINAAGDAAASSAGSTDKSLPKKYPWTLKRICAWILICALVAMYLITLILSLLSSPAAQKAFRASLLLTILLPILAWVFIWAAGYLTHRKTIASLNILNSNPSARKEMEKAVQKQEEENQASGKADRKDGISSASSHPGTDGT